MDKVARFIIYGLWGLGFSPLLCANSNDQVNIDTVQRVMHLLDQTYVDPVLIEDLSQAALQGLFSTLDPYSEYMTEQEYQDLLKEQKGVFAGVGVDLVTRDQFHVVVTPLFGSPAELSGIKAGDRLIRVNGVSVLGFPIDTAVRMIRGLPGTPVKLTFLRDGHEIDFLLYRGLIKTRPVRDECLIEGHIGYLKITRFKEGVFEDVRDQLQRLMARNISGFILDLRNNPGGLLTEAVKVVSLFLKKNKVVVRVKGRDRSSEKKYRVSADSLAVQLPLCVLINEGSASAAEVVAGAFQDYQRATVIGQKSFGKGSIQTLIPLPQGGAVRFTTHRYVLPLGDLVEGQGIIPDLAVSTPEMEQVFRIDLRQIKRSDGDMIQMSMNQIDDAQLKAAIEDLLP